MTIARENSLLPCAAETRVWAFLPGDASALSDARFDKGAAVGTVFCARSIKWLEGSRPWLRRTRDLWRLNVGRLRCGGSPRRCDEVRQTAAGAVYRERVSQRQRGESWKKRF